MSENNVTSPGLTGLTPLRSSTRMRPSQLRSQAVQGIRLNTVRNTLSWHSLSLPPGHYVVGSASDCDIVVDVEGVAEKHCMLIVGTQRNVIKSHSPRTWVNDGYISEGALKVGDRLILGPVEFRIAPISAPMRTAAVSTPSTASRFGSLPDPGPANVPMEIREKLDSTAAPRDASLIRREAHVQELLNDLQRSLDLLLFKEKSSREEFSRERMVLTHRSNELETQWIQLQDARRKIEKEAAASHQSSLLASAVEQHRRELEERHDELAGRARQVTAEHHRLKKWNQELQNRQQSFAKIEEDAHAEKLRILIARHNAQQRHLAQRQREIDQREEACQLQIAEISSHRIELLDQTRHLEEEQKLFATKCRNRERFLDEFETSISSRIQEVEEEASRLSNWSRRISDQETQLSNLQLQVEDRHLAATKAAEETEAERLALAEGRTQLTAARLQFEQEHTRFHETQETARAMHALELDSRNQKIASLESREQKLQQRELDLQQRTQALSLQEDQLRKLREQLEVQQIDINETRINQREFEQSLQDRQAEISHQEARLNARAEQLEAAQAELEVASTQIQHERASIEALKQNDIQATAELAIKQGEAEAQYEQAVIQLAAQRDQLESQRNEHAQECAGQKARFQAEQEKLDQQRVSTTEQLSDLEKERENLERSREEIQTELSELAAERQNLARLRGEIAAERQRDTYEREQLQITQKRIAASQQALEEQQLKLNQEQLELHQRREEMEFERLSIQAAADCDSIETEIQDSYAQSDAVNIDGADNTLRADLAALEEKHLQIQAEREELQHERHTLESKSGSLQSQTAQILAEQERLKIFEATLAASQAEMLERERGLELSRQQLREDQSQLLADRAALNNREEQLQREATSRNRSQQSDLPEPGDFRTDPPSHSSLAAGMSSALSLDSLKVDSQEDECDEELQLESTPNLTLNHPVEASASEGSASEDDEKAIELRRQLASLFGMSAPTTQHTHETQHMESAAPSALHSQDSRQQTERGAEVPPTMKQWGNLTAQDIPLDDEISNSKLDSEIEGVEEPAFVPAPADRQQPSRQAPDSSEDEGELSVATYMERLLERTRRSSAGHAYQAEPQIVSKPKAERVIVNPVSQPIEEIIPKKARKLDDTEKKSLRANLHSFREVANQSARTAVAKSQCVQKSSSLRTTLVMNVIGWAMTLALLLSEFWLGRDMRVEAALAGIVTAILSVFCFHRFNEIRRLRDHQRQASESTVEESGAATQPADENSKSGPLSFL